MIILVLFTNNNWFRPDIVELVTFTDNNLILNADLRDCILLMDEYWFFDIVPDFKFAILLLGYRDHFGMTKTLRAEEQSL